MANQGRAILPLGADKDEIDLYWADIKGGITHEDEFDHVYGLNLKVVAIGKPLVTATHFWNADLGPESPAENADEYGLGEFQNSWQKVCAPSGCSLSVRTRTATSLLPTTTSAT
ncbi:hypothetical protein AYO38_11710 [bacterium SCGC AG-212-C10]|nr:hypothetical protein AYO38_11710 [bacterium SCGC AG-212-C10]